MLALVAVASVFGGLLNAPFTGNWLDGFLGPTVSWREVKNVPLHVVDIQNNLMLYSAILACVVCVTTWFIYRGKPQGELLTEAQKQRNPIWRILYNKWFVDEFYDSTFVVPGVELARGLWRVVDNLIVDGMVKGVTGGVSGLANAMKNWQSGYVRNYALSMLVGVVLVVVCCRIGMSAGLVR